MEIGIVGLPQAGKRTLFDLLTSTYHTEILPRKGAKTPDLGMSKVYDDRLDRLAKLYNPEKVIPAAITYIMLPRLSKTSDDNQDAFKAIQNVDAICHVVRAHSDESVFHIDGSVDPGRDIEFLESEFILHDSIFTEHRIARLDKDIKIKNDPLLIKERELMVRINDQLNKEIPLRLITFTEDEEKVLNAYPYLSRKNMLVVLNADEDAVNEEEGQFQDLLTACEAKGIHSMLVSAKIEKELAELTDEEERRQFLESLGITRSALEKMTQLSYRACDRISFFTVGEDEVRAWTVRRFACAPEAGGAVHSDIERGFIRAEHMRVEDILTLGSEAAVKEAGKFSLKGKTYEVCDGDILHFRFSVDKKK
ncbi:MAG: YchF family ATPase [Candidatus Omnitrophica bacterium]|nr:YchF family ATPase [Candidatus Omnitrophota bacterium]